MLGYYFLIQHIPDWSRMEPRNLGVGIFVPEIEFLKIKYRNDMNEKLFSCVSSIESSLKNFSKPATKESLDEFFDSFANEISFVKLRECKINNPQKQLEELFIELVL